jgi:hypothetical protein
MTVLKAIIADSHKVACRCKRQCCPEFSNSQWESGWSDTRGSLTVEPQEVGVVL